MTAWELIRIQTSDKYAVFECQQGNFWVPRESSTERVNRTNLHGVLKW